MVSAMMTAIRDFAQDSFRTAEHASLDHFEIGDLSVWIEQGPEAVIAAVIRGTAPKDFRRTLQDAVERVHLQFGDALASFKGDAQPFDAARPILEECLQSEFRADQSSRSRLLPAIVAVLLVALSVWAVLAWRQNSRWNRYLTALRHEPGIVVISTGRAGGRYSVTGLRDALARDPAQLLGESDLTAADVVGSWEPYQALATPFVAARAARVLRPPDGVTLQLHRDVLSASGLAPESWIADAQRLAPLIPGVSRFDATRLVEARLEALTHTIAGVTILFERGTTEIVGDGPSQLRTLSGAIRDLDRTAATLGRVVALEIVGHTDGDGDAASNVPLSRARAQRVLQALDAAGLRHVSIDPEGVGSNDPLRRGDSESDKQQNRRVTLGKPVWSPDS
jgi:OOP family OmpA-OmpF porin